MNNNLISIQDMLFEEMQRIKDLDLNNGLTNRELQRSDALSKNACTYIKAVNTNIKIKQIAQEVKKDVKIINDELGI